MLVFLPLSSACNRDWFRSASLLLICCFCFDFRFVVLINFVFFLFLICCCSDLDSLWGRSPHLAEARSGFWKGERASEGRGCFECGTLNADRKANRKEPPCSTVFPHGASRESQLRNSKSQSQYNREERQRDLKQGCLSLGPSPGLLHSSADVGSSL